MPLLIARLHFEDDSHAADAFDQLEARATNTKIVGLGGPSESTSYALLMDDSGFVQEGFHVDTFGIVREGEYEPPPNSYPLWQPVTGGENAYPATNAAGEITRVEWQGHEWENAHGNGNSWEPGVFGWSDLGEVGA